MGVSRRIRPETQPLRPFPIRGGGGRGSAHPTVTKTSTMAEKDRLYFGSIEEVIEPPNLIEVQSRSYDEFLQQHTDPSERNHSGLEQIFHALV